MGAVHHAVQIDGEVPIPVGGHGLHERPDVVALGSGIAGVVDENVDVAGRPYGCGNRFVLGDVEWQCLGLASGGAHLASHGLGALADVVVDEDLRPGLGDGEADAATDSLPAPGDRVRCGR